MFKNRPSGKKESFLVCILHYIRFTNTNPTISTELESHQHRRVGIISISFPRMDHFVKGEHLARRLEPRRSPGEGNGNSYGSYDGGGGSSSHSSSALPSYSNYNSHSSSSYGKESHYQNGGSSNSYGGALHVPLAWVILIVLATYCFATLVAAHQFEHNPEGNFTNFCRLCINTLDCLCKLVYNLYHCRLNEIPTVVCAEEHDDEYTEHELQTMKLRPGIGRALEVEHNKSMRKTAQHMNGVKTKKAKGKGNTSKNRGRVNLNSPV
jgi:hypothetical protein